MPPPMHENRMVGMLQEELRLRMGAPGAAGFIHAFVADVLMKIGPASLRELAEARVQDILPEFV